MNSRTKLFAYLQNNPQDIKPHISHQLVRSQNLLIPSKIVIYKINGQTMNGASTTLLKPKSLNNVLAEANTSGVKCTLLLNHEGSLLAHAGGTNTESVTIAALASTIWRNYQRYGNSALLEDKLKSAVIQSQDANMIVRNLSTVLLCICATDEVPLGMLKCKADTIAEYLEGPLNLFLKN